MVYFVHKWDPRAARCGVPARAFSASAHENALCMDDQDLFELDPVVFDYICNGNAGLLSADGFIRNADGVEFELVPLAVHGHTRKERKEAARELARRVERMLYGGMSWFECAYMAHFFETLGRKCGLLREFRENGFC